MYDSLHFSHGTKEGLRLSAFNESGSPHSDYNFLGVHSHTQDSASNLVEVMTNENDSLFAELSPLDVKCREVILLINNRLTPIPAHSMMFHSVPEAAILKLDSLTWPDWCLVTTVKDSGLASNAPYSPAAYKHSLPSVGGPELNFMPVEIRGQNINITNGFLLQEAPTDASSNVIAALWSPTLKSFQRSTMQSAFFS